MLSICLPRRACLKVLMMIFLCLKVLMEDFEAQMRRIEQKAYASVLRAFKAQADAISWVINSYHWITRTLTLLPTCSISSGIWHQEKESLITDLRKELRVSDDEHRELLSSLDADETLRGMRFFTVKTPLVDERCYAVYFIIFMLLQHARVIREWRPVGGCRTGIPSTSRPFHDLLPSLTIPGSCQKQRISQSVSGVAFCALWHLGVRIWFPDPHCAGCPHGLYVRRRETCSVPWARRHGLDATG